jgi:hypothetical protein
MAQDYYKYAHVLSDFDSRLIKANPEFTTAKTGYENYYIDLISYWRELYDPETYDDLIAQLNTLRELKDKLTGEISELEDTISALVAGSSERLEQEKIFSEKTKQLETTSKELELVTEQLNNQNTNYYLSNDDKYKYWNKTVYEAPHNLNFWFDFLDSGELMQYDVKSVGCRPKSINDSNVKAIYFRETPNVLFIQPGQEKESGAYAYIKIPLAYVNTMFSISA